MPTNTKTNHFQVRCMEYTAALVLGKSQCRKRHLVNFYVLQFTLVPLREIHTYFIQDSNVSVFCNNYLPTFK